MYDCMEEKLYSKKYSLPHSLSLDNSVKIATDENNQFAVLIFSTLTTYRHSPCTYLARSLAVLTASQELGSDSRTTIAEEQGANKMLIFTEADGFQEITDYKHDLDEFSPDICSSLIFVHS